MVNPVYEARLHMLSMLRHPVTAGLLALACVHALVSPAQAQERPARGEERRGAPVTRQAPEPAHVERPAVQQDTMGESIRRIRSSNRGQVISAERMLSNGRQINRIKMMDDRGRVRVFEDDPLERRRSRRGDD